MYVVVANGGAGSTEIESVSAAVARLAVDAPTQLVWTDQPSDFVELVRDLSEETQLVVAGGDGSIHLALCTLTDLEHGTRPTGIIPLGTGNDFARNHGIPLDPTEAAEVVIAGHAVDVDAMTIKGTVEGTPSDETDRTLLVANNLHVGLGVRAAQTAKNWKRTLKKFAYPVATAFEGVRGDTTELEVRVDGELVWDGPLLAALVLLGPSMGGGIEMVPDQPDQLDVVLVEPADADERAALVAAALRGRIYDADRARHLRAESVTITGRDGLAANIDGEMIDFSSPITLTHLPAAWKVYLPS